MNKENFEINDNTMEQVSGGRIPADYVHFANNNPVDIDAELEKVTGGKDVLSNELLTIKPSSKTVETAATENDIKFVCDPYVFHLT